MNNKIIILALLLSSFIVFSPAQNYAASGTVLAVATRVSPQIRITIGGDRRRHRGWRNGRPVVWYNYRYRPQYVRETYWINGRRYYRWVRTY